MPHDIRPRPQQFTAAHLDDLAEWRRIGETMTADELSAELVRLRGGYATSVLPFAAAPARLSSISTSSANASGSSSPRATSARSRRD